MINYVWIDAGRETDISHNSARHYRSSGVREHAGNPSQIRTQRIYTKISTILSAIMRNEEY